MQKMENRSSSYDVIKEIGMRLHFPIQVINDASSYYYKMFEHATAAHFTFETVLIACIYLSSKVNEETRRVRDIINVVLYTLNWRDTIAENEDFVALLPQMTMKEYFTKREEVWKVEQHLLRIMNYELQPS